MKKVLFVLFASAILAACGDSATETETTSDSTMITEDPMMPAPMDSTMLHDSTMMSTDTTMPQ
jgi:uncharacterized lipoprotein YajG